MSPPCVIGPWRGAQITTTSLYKEHKEEMKRILAVFLSLVMSIGLVPSALADTSTNTALLSEGVLDTVQSLSFMRSSDLDDENAIRETIELFSQAKIEQLNDYDAERYDFTDFFVPNYEDINNLKYICDRFELDRQMLNATNAVNLWYSVGTDIQSIDITNNQADVVFYETYEYARVNTPTIKTTEGLTYWVSLEKNNGIWLINDIITDSTYDNVMRDVGLNIEEIVLGACDTSLETQTEDDAIGVISDSEPDASNRATVSYSASRAASYAKLYATSYNLNFFDYKEQGLGDCQNFASQCVWWALGGKNNKTSINNKEQPMVDLPDSNDRDWFQMSTWKRDVNNHWASVTSFASYISSASSSSVGPRGTIRSGINYAKVGDIIQVGNSSQGYYHSYIVVQVTGTAGSRSASNIWVCSHTNDYNTKQLSDVYSTSNYYRTIQITGATY